MILGSQRATAPVEAALAPFRWHAAAMAWSQEGALAFGEAATEVMSGVLTIWTRQALIGLSWAETAGEALPIQANGGARRRDSGFDHHLQEVAMKVSECMTREVQLADPNDTIADAAKTMARLDAGVLPVSENDRLVGMITDRDIAIRAVALGRGPDARVSEVMNAEVKYCFDDEEVGDVMRKMGELQLRRMPVLNHEKRLVGIISLGDMASRGEASQAGDALCDISQPGGQHSQTAH